MNENPYQHKQQKDYKSLKKWDKIVEYWYWQKIESTLLDNPKNDNWKWTWQSITSSWRVIDYLLTEWLEHYWPNLKYEEAPN